MWMLKNRSRKYTVLYDQTNDKYGNSEYKDKNWNIISTTLQIEGECLKLPFRQFLIPKHCVPTFSSFLHVDLSNYSLLSLTQEQ